MADIELYESKVKNTYGRTVATEWRGDKYNICFCFPSVEAKDIHAAFESGIINSKTKIIPCEKNPNRRDLVAKQLLTRTNNFTDVIKSPAHKVDLNRVLLSGEKIDYMPFDICGNFTISLAAWFYKNQKHFANGMRLPLTLQVNNKKFVGRDFNTINKITKGKYQNFVHHFCQKNRISHKNSEMLLQTTAMQEGIASQLYLLLNCMPDKNIVIRQVNVYRNSDISDKASYMMMVDAIVYDIKNRNKIALGNFRKVVEGFNLKAKKQDKLILEEKKTKVSKTAKVLKRNKIDNVSFKNPYEIARHMGIFGTYAKYQDIPKSKRAWIKINATKAGLNPDLAVQKISNRMDIYGKKAK